MEIQIHDTYVKGKNGEMHFDVAIEEGKGKDNAFAVECAKKWRDSIGEGGAEITSKECQFCHVQGANENIANDINKNGYSIIKMSGCP